MAHEDHIIDHLSKEIETQTHNIVVFRSKVVLTIILGPFIALGSFIIGTKGASLSLVIDRSMVIAFVVICICFIGLGLAAAIVEQHVWDQCNRWRSAIIRLRTDPSVVLEEKDILFKSARKGAGSISGYLIIYSLLLLSFISTIIIITHLHVMEVSDKPTVNAVSAPAQTTPAQIPQQPEKR